MFNFGGNVPLGFSVYGPDGVTLTNAASVVITVTLPDGTTATPTVANPSTGVYTATGPSSQAGRYLVGYSSTNPTDQTTDQYDVRPAVSAALLSLTDAKAALNIPAADHTNDEEIRDKLDAVTDLVESIIGYVVPRAVTATVVLSGSAFFLPGPVISLTSITPVLTNGWVYTAADFLVETSGLVTRLDGVQLSGQAYTVVYQAGRSGPIDARILEAARLLIQHMWRVQRGSGTRPGQGSADDEAYSPPMIPPRVYEILQRDRIVSVA